jgi:hypothetical protein
MADNNELQLLLKICTLLFILCHQITKARKNTNLIYSFCGIWCFGVLVAGSFLILTGQ